MGVDDIWVAAILEQCLDTLQLLPSLGLVDAGECNSVVAVDVSLVKKVFELPVFIFAKEGLQLLDMLLQNDKVLVESLFVHDVTHQTCLISKLDIKQIAFIGDIVV